MYLVTGGGGFIGSHLVRALVRTGARVRVLDNDPAGARTHLGAFSRGEFEWIDGDVRDAALMARACRGVEVVFHLAALASVPYSVAHPVETHEVNVTGTLNTLLAARDGGVRRVVLSSSCAVYGDSPVTPTSERLPPAPVSPYGAQKLAAEGYCRAFTSDYGLETTVLRYFNVFGPGQDPHGAYSAVVPRFLGAARSGERPVIYGDGEQSRDFIYVGNVVEANLRAATAPAASGATLNVGTGMPITVNALAAAIGRVTGRPLAPVYAAARAGDIRESAADVTLLRTLLDYTPTISLEEGLELTARAWGVAAANVAARAARGGE